MDTVTANMVRILISEARGMCTDEVPHEQIDVMLGLALDKLDALESYWKHPQQLGENA